MSRLTDAQVDAIAMRLARTLRPGAAPAAPAAASAPTGEGIHADVDAAVAAARRAFVRLGELPLAVRERMIAAIRDVMRREGDRLARLAHEETGLGRCEDKVVKNRLVTEKTPGCEELRPQTWSGDRGLTLTEWAPFGVIGAITPTTNPTSTIICNTIGMVAAGNTVVFNVHPSAVRCSMETVRLIHRAVREAGGPEDVVTAVGAPTVESAQALMTHPGVRLLVVTGGAGVVKAAMRSGKRAICAGPGNPPVVVDASCDPAAAARHIVRGASFDNNIICVDEKEVFVVAEAADALLRGMRDAGAYLASGSDLRKLEATIFSETRGPRRPGVMAKDCIGKNAGEILRRAGIPVDGDPRLVACDVPEDHPLVWTEQMMPVLPVVRVPDVDRAIELAREAEHGFGHSAAMHSRDIDALSRMARVMNTSIFVKNGPIYSGLGEGGEGYTSFTIASPTGEGLTGPLSFSRRRRCVLVDHFRIV
ncbi:MAG TPA: aldehyde dehydrogenase EutE [Candidatus Krumholzibacteria bacterium]|nr:aldehyde dehydrogenase EutE [Candidatus Krumholzibacteria bacterium]HRX51035.1 aldehyde dehydrogenase EutE [Candidatus Krumholzibacteria bacterium]